MKRRLIPMIDLMPDVIGRSGQYATAGMVMAWRLQGHQATDDFGGTNEVWYWGKCKPSADRAVLSLFGCLDAALQ